MQNILISSIPIPLLPNKGSFPCPVLFKGQLYHRQQEQTGQEGDNTRGDGWLISQPAVPLINSSVPAHGAPGALGWQRYRDPQGA